MHHLFIKKVISSVVFNTSTTTVFFIFLLWGQSLFFNSNSLVIKDKIVLDSKPSSELKQNLTVKGKKDKKQEKIRKIVSHFERMKGEILLPPPTKKKDTNHTKKSLISNYECIRMYKGCLLYTSRCV